MMGLKRTIKAWCLALATASTTLITAATCDPYSGFFDFYRDDDSGDYFYDDFFFDDGFYYDDPFYFDDCFFDCF